MRTKAFWAYFSDCFIGTSLPAWHRQAGAGRSTAEPHSNKGLSLAVFRIGFGLLVFISQIRFLLKGWVDACYLSTDFHFTYQYFSWVKPLSPDWLMYALVIVSALAALLVAIGLCYRWAAIVLFLSFTYLELIEQSWYLNHYYLVALLAFLLCWLPADNCLSMRSWLPRRSIPIWYADVIRLQLGLVYFFAGLAKLRSDWLLEAQPLKIWLRARTDTPIIGSLFAYEETAYLFSYGGMMYDLTIPFFLWYSRTRPFAFLAVIGFHAMTALLFPIGMFPWVMIAGSLIFFTDEEWGRWLRKFRIIKLDASSPTILSAPDISLSERQSAGVKKLANVKLYRVLQILLVIYFGIQIVLPMRRLFYYENQLWTERHYRFGWNVMLAEKTGNVTYRIVDKNTDRTWVNYPGNELSKIQEKQMAYQPDMIWQYAQHLAEKYRSKEDIEPAVYADCRVSFNGRPSQLYLPPDLNLLTVTQDEIYDWVMPLSWSPSRHK
ncbi:MAG: HTTM domain-containing protein [Bacteroidota bacterium]